MRTPSESVRNGMQTCFRFRPETLTGLSDLKCPQNQVPLAIFNNIVCDTVSSGKGAGGIRIKLRHNHLFLFVSIRWHRKLSVFCAALKLRQDGHFRWPENPAPGFSLMRMGAGVEFMKKTQIFLNLMALRLCVGTGCNLL